MAKKTTKAAKVTTTKEIGASVGAAGDITGQNDSLSIVAKAGLDRALTPQQCYQINSVFRRAVNVTADNESKAVLRFFSRRSNTEITSGDAVNFFKRPNQYQSGCQFVADMARWWKVSGEIAILPLVNGKVSKLGSPTGMKLINPGHLTAYPVGVRSLEFVDHWQYQDGRQIDNASPIFSIGASGLIFRKNWNPYSEVRGISEAITLVNEVSTNYYAATYNISRFKNGCQGDLIVVFPKGTKPKVAKEFVENWSEQHSVHNGNGFKIAAVIGDETEIKELGVQDKEGEFLQLSQYGDDKIAGLIGCPASVMGFYAKTRFDTIDAELESWAENTLMPDLRLYSEVYQDIVDRYFSSSSGTAKTSLQFTKKMRKEYELVMDNSQESDVVCIFDPDSLPILARLNLSKIEQVAKAREAMDLSANEACEYVGIDIPYSKLRDDVWKANNLVNVSAIERAKTVAEPAAELPIEPANSTDKADKTDKELIEKMKEFYRDFRATAIESVALGKNFSKDEFATKAEEIGDKFLLQFHRDFIRVKALAKQAEAIDEMKKYFNSISKPSHLKQLVEKK